MAARIQSLQALRGIGFLLIFCSHCTFINFFSSAWGGTGVSIFIILSGFVVTLGYNYNNLRCDLKAIPYTLKRICKIFPLHIIMLSIRLLYGYYQGIETPDIIIFLNITMIKSFIPIRDIYYSLIGVTWYLTLVWVFALFTPLLLRILRGIGEKYWLCLFFVIVIFRVSWLYYWHTDPSFQWWSYINPIFRLTDYFLGMIIGANINTIKKKIFIVNNNALLFFIAGCFISYIVALSTTELPWFHIYIRTPLTIGLIIIFVSYNQFETKIKKFIYENKFFIFIGNISFELFLIHVHVINIVNYSFGKINMNNNILKLGIIFALSIALAKTYSYIERKARMSMNIERKKQR